MRDKPPRTKTGDEMAAAEAEKWPALSVADSLAATALRQGDAKPTCQLDLPHLGVAEEDKEQLLKSSWLASIVLSHSAGRDAPHWQAHCASFASNVLGNRFAGAFQRPDETLSLKVKLTDISDSSSEVVDTFLSILHTRYSEIHTSVSIGNARETEEWKRLVEKYGLEEYLEPATEDGSHMDDGSDAAPKRHLRVVVTECD
jgi:hypothetical protein